MSEAWSVDMEGQQIAKSWNHKGKAHTVRKQNVGGWENIFVIIDCNYVRVKTKNKYDW
jgi:hypothetical protein